MGCHGSCEGHLVYGRSLPRPARRVLSGHEQQGNGASGDDFESPGFAVQHDVPDHGRQGRGSELRHGIQAVQEPLPVRGTRLHPPRSG